MKITDEAVQAFKNEFHENSPKRSYVENIKASLSAALPHLPLGFEVKQLVWSEYDDEQGVLDSWDAEACGFHLFYEIQFQNDGYRAVFDHEAVGAIGLFGTLDQAKAAAQADFERRVRECIVAKPVDVAAVRGQAFEEVIHLVDYHITDDDDRSTLRAAIRAALAQGGGE